MPFVVVVANRKGGVGKSTISVSLAVSTVCSVAQGQRSKKRSKKSEPAEEPTRVDTDPILVDADSQGNATTWCLEGPADELVAAGRSVACLAYPVDRRIVSSDDPLALATSPEEVAELALSRALVPVPRFPRLGLIPSTPRFHPEQSERLCLRELPSEIVVVDTGSDCSTPIVRSIISQADAVVVPVVCEPWGTDGIRNVLEEIRSVGRGDLIDRRLVRVVVNRREKTKTQDILEASLRDQLGSLVSDVVVPKSAPIALLSAGSAVVNPRHKGIALANDIWSDIFDSVKGVAA